MSLHVGTHNFFLALSRKNEVQLNTYFSNAVTQFMVLPKKNRKLFVCKLDFF